MESSKINQDEFNTIKTVNNYYPKKANCLLSNNYFKLTMLLVSLFVIICQKIIINELKKLDKNLKENKSYKNNYDLSYQYHLYEREMITEKMKNYSGWQLMKNEPYFINGIVRKFKPKKCLEIGVAKGGSSIIILNALKDVDNSFLVSLDLNTYNRKYRIGENVNKYFPELTKNNKWRLYTGEQPHKFLDKLNLKFDFLFLDTVHLTPGELINIIEALPFL